LSDRRVDTIDFPRRRSARRRLLLLLALVGAFLFGTETILSYYVDALWFGALGYRDVFWKTLNIQSAVFTVAGVATFTFLIGGFNWLKPPGFGELNAGRIIINGRPVTLPIGPVLSLAVSVVSAIIAFGVAVGLSSDWSTIALWWYGRLPVNPSQVIDPIFGRPLDFYLFTLPAWQLAAGWFMTLAVLTFGMGLFFFIVSPGATSFRQRGSADADAGRRLLLSAAPLIAALAAQIYLGRFERLFDDHTTFAGITYTEAHVTVPGMLLVAMALAAGAIAVVVAAFIAPRVRWLAAAVLPAVALYLGTGAIGAYVEGFIVKPTSSCVSSPTSRTTSSSPGRLTGSIGSRSVRSRQKRQSRRLTPRTTRRRSRTFGSGTGACCRTRCVNCRRFVRITTFPISTSIATSSTELRGRSCSQPVS
jgi:uncharacterized membrane protein (UPF0182 family)